MSQVIGKLLRLYTFAPLRYAFIVFCEYTVCANNFLQALFAGWLNLAFLSKFQRSDSDVYICD